MKQKEERYHKKVFGKKTINCIPSVTAFHLVLSNILVCKFLPMAVCLHYYTNVKMLFTELTELIFVYFCVPSS